MTVGVFFTRSASIETVGDKFVIEYAEVSVDCGGDGACVERPGEPAGAEYGPVPGPRIISVESVSTSAACMATCACSCAALSSVEGVSSLKGIEKSNASVNRLMLMANAAMARRNKARPAKNVDFRVVLPNSPN